MDVSTASSLQRSLISLFSCILARVRVVWKEFLGGSASGRATCPARREVARHFFLNYNGLYQIAPGRFEALSGGCQLFPNRPPFRRGAGLQPPHPARSMPWHRRRRTTRAPASCSADAWAAAVAGAAHSDRSPPPRPDAAAGAPVSSVPPWHTLARPLAQPSARLRHPQAHARPPPSDGSPPPTRSPCGADVRAARPPNKAVRERRKRDAWAIVTSRQPSPPLGGDQVARAGRHERHQRPHLGR